MQSNWLANLMKLYARFKFQWNRDPMDGTIIRKSGGKESRTKRGEINGRKSTQINWMQVEHSFKKRNFVFHTTFLLTYPRTLVCIKETQNKIKNKKKIGAEILQKIENPLGWLLRVTQYFSSIIIITWLCISSPHTQSHTHIRQLYVRFARSCFCPRWCCRVIDEGALNIEVKKRK